MIACATRVASASVRSLTPPAAWETVGRIDAGLLVLVGVEDRDQRRDTEWMGRKLAHLRVFSDDEGRMNRSVREASGSLLLVSQFTLCGDCSKGHRPSFISAAPPEIAEPTIEALAALLREEHGIVVECGRFRTHMQVESVNDGPVTIVLRSPASA